MAKNRIVFIVWLLLWLAAWARGVGNMAGGILLASALCAAAEIAALPDIACRGGSCFIDPFGHEASETVWDREAIIYADLDMQKVPASRMELDCVGHYARPDVLELRVNEK